MVSDTNSGKVHEAKSAPMCETTVSDGMKKDEEKLQAKSEIAPKTKSSPSNTNKTDNKEGKENVQIHATKKEKVQIEDIKDDYKILMKNAHKLIDQVKYVHYCVHKMSRRLEIQEINSKCPSKDDNRGREKADKKYLGVKEKNHIKDVNQKDSKEKVIERVTKKGDGKSQDECVQECPLSNSSDKVEDIPELTEKVLAHIERIMKDVNETMDIIMEKNQFDVEEAVEGEFCDECDN